MLCDLYSGYGTLQCSYTGTNGYCPGAVNNNCYPYIVWSDKRLTNSQAWSPELREGRFYEYIGDTGHPITQTMSVRCVLGFVFNFCRIAFFD